MNFSDTFLKVDRKISSFISWKTSHPTPLGTGCPLKLFERFKGAGCLAPLDHIYLGAEVAKIKKKGGRIGRSLKNRGELKSALDKRLKGFLKTRDRKKKEIIKNLRNIFPQYFEEL